MIAAGIFALALISAPAILLASRLGPTRLNPVTLYLGAWVFVYSEYAVAARSLNPLTSQVRLLVAAGSSALITGAVIARATFVKREPMSTMLYDDVRLAKAYRYGLLSLLAYTVVQMWRFYPYLRQAGGLSGILSGGGQQFRRAYLAATLQSSTHALAGGGIAFAVLGYALFVGTLTLVWAGHYAAMGRFRAAMLPVAIQAIFSLVTLQRSSFVYGLAIFLLSWFYHARVSESAPTTRWLSPWRLGILVTLTVLVVLLPLALRATSSHGSDRQVGVSGYVISGIAGVNQLSALDPTLAGSATGAASPFATEPYAGPEPSRGYGTFTFQGLASILQRLGLHIAVPSPAFAFITTPISKVPVTNTYTYVLSFYDDGGIVGVLIGSFLLGFLAMSFHVRTLIQRDVRLIAPAALLGTTVGMSWFGIPLLQDFQYVFVAAVGVWLTGRYVRPSSSVKRSGHVGSRPVDTPSASPAFQ